MKTYGIKRKTKKSSQKRLEKEKGKAREAQKNKPSQKKVMAL